MGALRALAAQTGLTRNGAVGPQRRTEKDQAKRRGRGYNPCSSTGDYVTCLSQQVHVFGQFHDTTK